MQILRVFFAFLRSVIAGMRSVVISYGKFLETTQVVKRPARKAHHSQSTSVRKSVKGARRR